MSGRLQGLVWEVSPYSGTKLLVMLCLADVSGETGCFYPCVAVLARLARTSVRNVRTIIGELVAEGVLQDMGVQSFMVNDRPEPLHGYAIVPFSSAEKSGWIESISE